MKLTYTSTGRVPVVVRTPGLYRVILRRMVGPPRAWVLLGGDLCAGMHWVGWRLVAADIDGWYEILVFHEEAVVDQQTFEIARS